MKALLKEALLSLYYVSLCTTARNLNSTESKATLFREAIKWFLLCKSDLKAHYKCFESCDTLIASMYWVFILGDMKTTDLVQSQTSDTSNKPFLSACECMERGHTAVSLFTSLHLKTGVCEKKREWWLRENKEYY